MYNDYSNEIKILQQLAVPSTTDVYSLQRSVPLQWFKFPGTKANSQVKLDVYDFILSHPLTTIPSSCLSVPLLHSNIIKNSPGLN